MSGDVELEDHRALLRANPSVSEPDLEAQGATTPRRKGIGELLRKLDRGLSGRRLSRRYPDGRGDNTPLSPTRLGPATTATTSLQDDLGDGPPPEWALLLIGCLLGVATGVCVAAFNRGVHIIHEWTWAGTPNEGAAWLRLQRLADTWHRILLIPVSGGVLVGMIHGLLEIFDQIKQSRSSQSARLDLLSGIFPTIKAIQAAVTLGTGCSLGPEGPSVDIGKSCAYRCSEMMENNRERRIALVAAGSAAGIASGLSCWHYFSFWWIYIKDHSVTFSIYRSQLHAQGAVGLAIWVPSVTNQSKDGETPDAKGHNHGYSSLSASEEKNEAVWRQSGGSNDVELSIVENDVRRWTWIQFLMS